MRTILSIPVDERTNQQFQRVFSYWRTTIQQWEEQNRRLEALWQSHPQGTTQMVLLERDVPRKLIGTDTDRNLRAALLFGWDVVPHDV